MLDKLRSQDFTPLLHETFTLALEPAGQAPPAAPKLELELMEVSGGARGAPADQDAPRVPFSLVFRSSERVHLPQRIYSLAHPALGELGLFLVPIAADGKGMLYQAVFG